MYDETAVNGAYIALAVAAIRQWEDDNIDGEADPPGIAYLRELLSAIHKAENEKYGTVGFFKPTTKDYRE